MSALDGVGYETHSKLAEAKIPMGATVTDISEAARWRDFGKDWHRRLRIRARKIFREPWAYVPNDITHKKEHFKIFLGGGNSTRGRTG